MSKKHLMTKLKRYAIIISAKRNEKPYSKFVAFRKIFIQEKRVWPSGIQIGSISQGIWNMATNSKL